MAVCPICLDQRFAPLASIDFGRWEADETGDLHRATELFDLASCRTCGHVMIVTPYDDSTFRRIYLDTPQDPVFWDEMHVGSTAPYADMVEFCLGGSGPVEGFLVDVGCGPGLLLKLLHEERGHALDRLVGIDFNRRLPDPYRFVRADLNRLDADDIPGPVALAFASHLLEHLVDPRAFLRTLAGRLAKGGAIYVEVPDNGHFDPAIVGPTNLINQQHIHYFCEASLTSLAVSCGLAVERCERSVLGYVPRLRMLLRPAETTSAGDTVLRSLAHLSGQRTRLAERLRTLIGSGRPAGLWGIGADFHRLSVEHPDIAALVEGDRIALFDLGLAGRRYAGQTIRPPTDIAKFDGTVFLMPLLGDVRLKMRRFAESQGFPAGRVIDPWLTPR